ncbi:hypothetical protein FRB94_002345 [Tulasnella sp. JGI-2019a]|nr:hypothetical protein FRB94_002345 [Tulasnella sp. JGI-2019a]
MDSHEGRRPAWVFDGQTHEVMMMSDPEFLCYLSSLFLKERPACTTTNAPSPALSTTCWSATQSTASLELSDMGSAGSTVMDEEDSREANGLLHPRPRAGASLVSDPITRPSRPVHIHPPMSHGKRPPRPEFFCVHDDGRRCDMGASFRRKRSTYIEHLNSLAGIHRYDCEACGAPFNRSNNRKRHYGTCKVLHPERRKAKILTKGAAKSKAGRVSISSTSTSTSTASTASD